MICLKETYMRVSDSFSARIDFYNLPYSMYSTLGKSRTL